VTITYQLLQGGPPTRWGATTGQADLGNLATRVESADGPVVVLDFEGIEAANGSYLRATALWMLRCAIEGRKNSRYEGEGSQDPWRIRPLAMEGFFLAGLSDEVRHDVTILLKEGRLPCLEVVKWEGDEIQSVAILGHLDTQLRRTFDCLLEIGEASSAETLSRRFPEDRIGVTGWNNRLAELYQRHLIGRRKDGKFWKYFTMFKEVADGLRLST
jgi:hypothetical protein